MQMQLKYQFLVLGLLVGLGFIFPAEAQVPPKYKLIDVHRASFPEHVFHMGAFNRIYFSGRLASSETVDSIYYAECPDPTGIYFACNPPVKLIDNAWRPNIVRHPTLNIYVMFMEQSGVVKYATSFENDGVSWSTPQPVSGMPAGNLISAVTVGNKIYAYTQTGNPVFALNIKRQDLGCCGTVWSATENVSGLTFDQGFEGYFPIGNLKVKYRNGSYEAFGTGRPTSNYIPGQHHRAVIYGESSSGKNFSIDYANIDPNGGISNSWMTYVGTVFPIVAPHENTHDFMYFGDGNTTPSKRGIWVTPDWTGFLFAQ